MQLTCFVRSAENAVPIDVHTFSTSFKQTEIEPKKLFMSNFYKFI
jgi:hypothetical protein